MLWNPQEHWGLVIKQLRDYKTPAPCSEDVDDHAIKRTLHIASWVCLTASGLAAVTALIGRWAVNAEAFGAHDLGLAVFLAFISSVAFIAATWSAPVFVLAGLVAQRVNQQSGLRLIIAGALSVVPLAGYTWL
ncbi:MAG: hypothetical protein ACQETK_08270 [Pseudomonadota bacterium]